MVLLCEYLMGNVTLLTYAFIPTFFIGLAVVFGACSLICLLHW